ncbi:MAG: hypothetical protein CMP63_02235 [Flavobacteriales bacterium]|nr:hypothetical protein [Flavobacteriales bacterium]|tara:strand:+ start:5945 stop:8431 length:2487 start_codon:yes stop_codon:yes gene_type:complete
MGNKKKSYEALQNEKELLQKELSSLEKSIQDVLLTISNRSAKLSESSCEEKLKYIQESIAKKEILLKSSGEFMAVCNHRFEFDFLNRAGRTLLGFSEDNNTKTFVDFIKEKKYFTDEVVPKVMQKNGWIGELTIHTENRVFPATCKVIPFVGFSSLREGFYLIVRDITESKEAIQKLVGAKNRAENNMMVRQQFLAKITHEIRTSMSAIIGLSNLLIDKGLKGDKLEFAHAIKLSADNLLVIINDILDISKIESGKLTVENIRFDFTKLMLGVKSIFQHKIESGGIQFKYDIDSKIPEYLIGDPTRLNQILLNLLSNSEKFTEHGQIALSAKLMHASDKNVKLRFRVKDTGIGIAGKNLEKIFQEFIQESDNTSRLYGGTGLGLAIVKQLVSLQNGRIWVESSKNKGSSFFIEIEYGVPEHEAIEKKITQNEFTDFTFKSANIIMAEDYPMNRLLAKSIFKKWGVNLKIVNNGKELLKELEKNSYDIILMDVQMPEMGGVEATEILREKGIETPVIAITAHSYKEEQILCSEAGMDDFLTKPFEESDLKQKLVDYLNLHVDDLPKEIVKQDEKDANRKIEHCNLDYIEELSAGDETFVNDMLTVFIHEIPDLLNKMILSLNSGDRQGIAKYAHRLQSSFLIIKREDVKTDLKLLELWGKNSKKMKNPNDTLTTIIKRSKNILNSIAEYIGKPCTTQILPIEFLMSIDELKKMDIDFSKLDEFGQGEIQFKKEIIGLYSQQTAEQIKEVKKLLNSKSYDRIALVIHNMIASFNLIGCQTLVNYSRGLEEFCIDVENEERFNIQIMNYILLIQKSIELVNKKGKKEGILT